MDKKVNLFAKGSNFRRPEIDRGAPQSKARVCALQMCVQSNKPHPPEAADNSYPGHWNLSRCWLVHKAGPSSHWIQVDRSLSRVKSISARPCCRAMMLTTCVQDALERACELDPGTVYAQYLLNVQVEAPAATGCPSGAHLPPEGTKLLLR
jgi:hypothetical protein